SLPPHRYLHSFPTRRSSDLAKMFTFAVSLGSGFVGGPIFPSLFIGGTAGVIVHQAIPSVPLGLAFTCLLAATVGALVAAPFAMRSEEHTSELQSLTNLVCRL